MRCILCWEMEVFQAMLRGIKYILVHKRGKHRMLLCVCGLWLSCLANLYNIRLYNISLSAVNKYCRAELSLDWSYVVELHTSSILS